MCVGWGALWQLKCPVRGDGGGGSVQSMSKTLLKSSRKGQIRKTASPSLYPSLGLSTWGCSSHWGNGGCPSSSQASPKSSVSREHREKEK